MHTPPSFSPAVAAAPRQSALRTALAGLIDNVLEWFDFAVYGYFATEIGRQFFPRSDPTAQQLLAFAVFALGFLARPFGSLVLGRVGDRIGRRALLTLSIAVMGGATLIVGITLCVVGWFLRRGISETAEGVKASAIRPPLLPSLLADWRPIVQTFGIVAMTNAAYYLTFTYAVERRKSLTGEGGEAFLLA